MAFTVKVGGKEPHKFYGPRIFKSKPQRGSISALKQKRCAMVVLLISTSTGGPRESIEIFEISCYFVIRYLRLNFITCEIFTNIKLEKLCTEKKKTYGWIAHQRDNGTSSGRRHN